MLQPPVIFLGKEQWLAVVTWAWNPAKDTVQEDLKTESSTLSWDAQQDSDLENKR